MFTRTFHFLPFLCCLPILFSPSLAKTVEYDLYVRNAPVNFTGATRQAMTINGSIPGPTLHFTEGDTAVIRVHNLMDTQTSFHWHGLLVPNDQDGVPYLTSAPVKPHTTHTYTFPERHVLVPFPQRFSGAERPVRSVHRPQTAR